MTRRRAAVIVLGMPDGLRAGAVRVTTTAAGRIAFDLSYGKRLQ